MTTRLRYDFRVIEREMMAKGLTGAAVCRKADLSPMVITHWRQGGQPSPESAAAIAKVLGIATGSLIVEAPHVSRGVSSHRSNRVPPSVPPTIQNEGRAGACSSSRRAKRATAVRRESAA